MGFRDFVNDVWESAKWEWGRNVRPAVELVASCFPFRREAITGTGGEPYMVRWTLFRCRWFGVKVHHFLRSDADPELHDHPCWFVSLILVGGYLEQFRVRRWRRSPVDGLVYFDETVTHWQAPGRLLYRPADHAHRIVIPPGRSAWTLVVVGPKSREWGFWEPLGWVEWREFFRARGYS